MDQSLQACPRKSGDMVGQFGQTVRSIIKAGAQAFDQRAQRDIHHGLSDNTQQRTLHVVVARLRAKHLTHQRAQQTGLWPGKTFKHQIQRRSRVGRLAHHQAGDARRAGRVEHAADHGAHKTGKALLHWQFGGRGGQRCVQQRQIGMMLQHRQIQAFLVVEVVIDAGQPYPGRRRNILHPRCPKAVTQKDGRSGIKQGLTRFVAGQQAAGAGRGREHGALTGKLFPFSVWKIFSSVKGGADGGTVVAKKRRQCHLRRTHRYNACCPDSAGDVEITSICSNLYIMTLLTLILALPTRNATARQRAWRHLKSAGAAVLRDGVYLLPDTPACHDVFDRVQRDVRAAGGTAHVLESADDGTHHALFDRGAAYAELIHACSALAGDALLASGATRQVARLRRQFEQISAIDFYPGPSREQALQAVAAAEQRLQQLLDPDEPRPAATRLVPCDRTTVQGRVWATRQRPWVDRLASAWLIVRHIDPQARFVWLARPVDCPPEALGFDFDGAAFTHVGALVTFEVLLARFGLQDPALQHLAAVVHELDVGGAPVAESRGVAAVLGGLRAALADDDALLAAALPVFDALYTHFHDGHTLS